MEEFTLFKTIQSKVYLHRPFFLFNYNRAKMIIKGTSLVVQRLKLHAPGTMGLVPGQITNILQNAQPKKKKKA